MSKKTISTIELEREYQQLAEPLQAIVGQMAPALFLLVEERRIKLGFPLQQRVKTWESILQKIRSRRINLKKTLLELQDLIGIRLVTLFASDLEPLADALADRFEVHKRYHTGDRLEHDQFGYNSLHLVIGVPEPLLGDRVWTRPPKAEVQLRTLSQHLWAEASNLFQYKQEEDVPRVLKRAFGRVSALLETVDIELDRVRDDRTRYRESIAEHPQSNELDVDNLHWLLAAKLPEANCDPSDDYAELHRILVILGIETGSELSAIIDRHKDEILLLDREVAAELGADRAGAPGTFMTHTGLVKMMLNDHLGTPWEQAVAERTGQADPS